MKNPHLAFDAIPEQGRPMTLPDMLGIPESRMEPMLHMLAKIHTETDMHSEALARISEEVETPQDLVMLSYLYIHKVMSRDLVSTP